MQNPRFFRYQAECFLRVVGPDAAEFLQGQFSNDLSALAAGELAYGLWLDRKGKIVADSFALRQGAEDFLLASYHCPESSIFDRLNAYLIMEEAELVRSAGPVRAFCVFGESAQRAACAALGVEQPLAGQFVAQSGVLVFWGRRGAEPALEILYPDGFPDGPRGKIDAALAGVDAMELSVEDRDVLAIEAKIPRIGLEFGSSDLPQELGLEKDAVSFRKGCYLGQEVMARLHAMGRVRKELVRVRKKNANTGTVSELPADLLDDTGKRQGQLRSIAYPESGCVGLAVVSVGFSGTCLTAESCVFELVRGRGE